MMNVWQATIVDASGNVLPSASVEVRHQQTAQLVQLYEDRDGAVAIGNPTTADSDGFVRFYTTTGRYQIEATLGATSRIWQDVIIGPLEYEATTAESAASVIPDDLRYEPGHIRRYGAVLDGTTDDTEAVQAWLDVGGNLYGVAGTAKVTDQLSITVDGTFIHGRSMKIVHDTTTMEAVFIGEQVVDILIEDLEIDGQKSQKSGSGSQEGYGIWLRGCDNVIVRGCYVHDCFEHGIDVAAINATDTSVLSENIQIIGNRVLDCGNASNSRGYGIWTFGLIRQLLVANNVVVECEAGGISSDDTSSGGTTLGRVNHRVVYSGNIVYGTETDEFIGLRYEGCSYGSITGNVVVCGRNACVVQSIQGNEPSELVTITGNYFQGDITALRLNDANDVSVTGNILVMPSDSTSEYRVAVDIYSQTQDPDSVRIVLGHNVIKSAQMAIGIGTNSGTQDPAVDVDIVGNNLHYIGASAAVTGYYGIHALVADRVSLRDNRIRGFYNGIVAVGDVDVLGNIVVDSENYGILLANADARVCKGNITRGSGVAGLRIETSTNNPNVILMDNVITDSISGSLDAMTRFGNSFPGSTISAITRATAADIASAASNINTIGKHTLKIIADSTNDRLMFALGPNATDGWRVADGSATVTPA